MRHRVWSIPLSLLILELGGAAVQAQPPASGTQSQTFQRMVEPSFRVQPIVHRFEGTRGEVIPFEYNIESSGREMNVEVALVALRQEENGLIVYDESRVPKDAIKMLTPANFRVAAGKSFDVKCEVTVPKERANFHSFGLLIRDMGQDTKLDPKNDPEGKPISRAQVKFITQYVLRCDIEVTNGGGDKLNNVIIESGKIHSHNGQPMARVVLNNPTDSAFEFYVRGAFPKLVGEDKPFNLIMPTRASLEGNEKLLIRLMPFSRVRLDAPVQTMLVPGSHDFQVELISRTRPVSSATFAVNVTPGDFPAQEVIVTRAGDSISVAPAQIELSQLKGGKRSSPIKFSNLSDTPQKVRLDAVKLNGAKFDELSLQLKEFTLSPGSSRKITVSLKSRPNVKEPLFGFLKVETRTGDEEYRSSSVPLAMMYAPWGDSQVEFSEPKWRDGDQPAMIVTATNKSTGFQPVDAAMVMGMEGGRSVGLAAGYGRWLRPGETYDLEFRMGGQLPHGLYQTRLTLMSTPGSTPINTTTNFRIGEEPVNGVASGEASQAADAKEPAAGQPASAAPAAAKAAKEAPAAAKATTSAKPAVTKGTKAASMIPFKTNTRS